jgi:hypothetical protein
MKSKTLMRILFISLIIRTSCIGCLAAYADDVRIGITAGWFEKFYFYNERITNNFVHEHYDSLELTALLDWRYVRVGLGYSKNILAYVHDNGVNNNHYTDYSISFINGSVLGKYPFTFYNDLLSIWPAAGLEYDYNIEYKKGGQDLSERYNELNDIYFLAGTGVDYTITEAVSLTSMMLVAYNLTPRVGDDATIGKNFKGASARIRFGCLFAL